jgi:hypothetical protein
VDKFAAAFFGKVTATGLSTSIHNSPTTENLHRCYIPGRFPLSVDYDMSGKKVASSHNTFLLIPVE